MVLRHYKLTTFGETKRFLRINDVLLDLLLFKEKLYVFDEDGRKVGRFSIKIDKAPVQNCGTFLVHISNRSYLKGNVSETIVTGVLTQNLKTIEEIRYEASEMNKGKHERTFYLLREKTNYYFSISQSACGIENKVGSTIPFTDSIGLIGEAANIVLMRAIAIRGYEGIFCLWTILSNGKKCRNYYVSKASERAVNGVKMPVMVIYRSVTDHKKYSVTSTSTFTKAGQMVSLFWSNSNYFLHVHPELEIYGNMVDENQEVGLHRLWTKDMQLFSYYLDKKNENEAKIRSYRTDMHLLKRISADWVQHLLMNKPDDIICAAVDFFSTFDCKGLRSCDAKSKPKVREKENPAQRQNLTEAGCDSKVHDIGHT